MQRTRCHGPATRMRGSLLSKDNAPGPCRQACIVLQLEVAWPLPRLKDVSLQQAPVLLFFVRSQCILVRGDARDQTGSYSVPKIMMMVIDDLYGSLILYLSTLGMIIFCLRLSPPSFLPIHLNVLPPASDLHSHPTKNI